jgi:type IV pilus assembly protein PilW
MKRLRIGTSLSRRQQGITLVELMIALLIGLFLMGGLATLLMNSKATFNAQNDLAQLQDNQRMALTMIADVVQHGGYFPDPLNNTAADVTNPFFGTDGAPGDTMSIEFRTTGGDDVLNCSGTSNTGGAGVLINYVNKFYVSNGQLFCELQVVGGAATQYALVSDVQDMQIFYGVQRNAVAACINCVDTYLAATNMTNADWKNVISVAVTLTFGNPLYTDGSDNQPQTISVRRVIPVMSKVGIAT